MKNTMVWKSLAVTAAGLGVFFLIFSTREGAASAEPKWKLTWSDDFKGRDGSAPDEKKWVYDIGATKWGNNELESYTDRRENSRIEKGNLVITAKKEQFTGKDGVPAEYTSARLKTLGKFSQAYGRFEARIKIPRGQGIWPAFWMMGDDIATVHWPNCGEIDVMENIGKEPNIVSGSLHGPSNVGETTSESKEFKLAPGQKFADAYHVYAIEWEPERVRFFVDDNNYSTFEKANWKNTGKWPFDHPFFILLNVAVGGDWPGNPDATTQFPQDMLVDYVRVYEKAK